MGANRCRITLETDPLPIGAVPPLITTLMQLTGLSPAGMMIVVTAVFLAGLIRGFAGFGLSAVVMASAATILPPIELDTRINLPLFGIL